MDFSFRESIIVTDLYMSPAERLVVFDRCGLGSPARLMSEKKEKRERSQVSDRTSDTIPFIIDRSIYRSADYLASDDQILSFF